MLEDIITHLSAIYNYQVRDNDVYLIDHLIERVTDLIKRFCHVRSIPKGAYHLAIDYICGCFFMQKIQTNSLIDENGEPLYTFSAPEASVTVGDVSVGFESGYGALSADNGFYDMVKELADEDRFKRELVHFRKVKWKPF